MSQDLAKYHKRLRGGTYPAMKLLKGKLVMSTAYANCMMPLSIKKTRKASSSFNLTGVFLL